jgi:deoxyribonuclease V
MVEAKIAKGKTRFPYIPTLLSYRELPPVLVAFRKLQTQPDVIMVDGQGYAHPYHCGFACHLGLTLDIPTIGVAKSRLIGDIEPSPREKDCALLKLRGETVGAAVTTRSGSPPVFVSVGHKISLKSAVSVVNHCILQNRVPEPIMKAHEAANSEKRKIQILSTTNDHKTK